MDADFRPESSHEMKRKILFFAPLGSWIVHTQVDCVVGAALKNRGCDVRALGCDGLFEECYAKGTPRDESRCRECQSLSCDWFSRFGIPLSQMSALISPAEKAEAEAWAQGLDVTHFTQAKFRHWAIGHWMIWLLHSDLRRGTIDFSDPVVRKRAHEFAKHGALIALATDRMLKDFRPDQAVCYSGSMSYYRVFFELCREASVPVLVHERGSTDGSFVFFANMTAYQRQREVQPSWQEHWQHVPLDEAQWRRVADLFSAREKGGAMNFQEIHRFRSEGARVRDRLRLPANARVVVALASGDWEFGMFHTYGGLGVLWDTQLEWLDETSRICAANGWHLVVRHHPLGAGKKAYPRASEFLASIIRHPGHMEEHVRVIMPGENLSTYDLMSFADAVVSQFSSGGAESMIRGLPVVCVAASGLRHMGMDWVEDKADYAAALERAMSQPPPQTESVLRQAFRYANFHYYTMGSMAFSSVGVKNVYQPDFRLNSPDDLQPGVDPTMDRLCEHILEGGPLYPLPTRTVEPDVESALTAEYRDELVARRAQLGATTTQSHSRVAVCLLGTDASNFPVGRRSRHREVEFHTLPLDAAGGARSVAEMLCAVVENLDTPFVYFMTEGIELDESALSQAVDLLENPEHASKKGVLLGCYTFERDGVMGPEWNTVVHPPDTARPQPPMAVFSRPLSVLGLVVWRREHLVSWLETAAESIKDADATWCTVMLRSFLDESQFGLLAEPLVYFAAVAPPSTLLAKAAALAEADVDGALRAAAEIAAVCGYSDGLRLNMARWLIAARRHGQALPLITAAMKAGEGSKDAWSEFQRALPEAFGRKDGAWLNTVKALPGILSPEESQMLHDKVLSLSDEATIVVAGAGCSRLFAALAYASTGTRRRIHWHAPIGMQGEALAVAMTKVQVLSQLRRLGLESAVQLSASLGADLLTRCDLLVISEAPLLSTDLQAAASLLAATKAGCCVVVQTSGVNDKPTPLPEAWNSTILDLQACGALWCGRTRGS